MSPRHITHFRNSLLTALCLLAPLSAANADTITLSSGKQIQGIIHTDTQSALAIETPAGIIRCPRNTVASVQKSANSGIAASQQLYINGQHTEALAALQTINSAALSKEDQFQVQLIRESASQQLASTAKKQAADNAAEAEKLAGHSRLLAAHERQQRMYDFKKKQATYRALEADAWAKQRALNPGKIQPVSSSDSKGSIASHTSKRSKTKKGNCPGGKCPLK